MGRLHDLGVEHQIGVGVVDAVEVGSAEGSGDGVEAAVFFKSVQRVDFRLWSMDKHTSPPSHACTANSAR